jgi:hypothetical protein
MIIRLTLKYQQRARLISSVGALYGWCKRKHLTIEAFYKIKRMLAYIAYKIITLTLLCFVFFTIKYRNYLRIHSFAIFMEKLSQKIFLSPIFSNYKELSGELKAVMLTIFGMQCGSINLLTLRHMIVPNLYCRGEA